jgi:hypothetical protein
MQKGISAVATAVDTSWSTGQVEGQINRLNMIKRQMYDRNAGRDARRWRSFFFYPFEGALEFR